MIAMKSNAAPVFTVMTAMDCNARDCHGQKCCSGVDSNAEIPWTVMLHR